MKHRVLFSLKDKSKKKCHLLQFGFAVYRLKTLRKFGLHNIYI